MLTMLFLLQVLLRRRGTYWKVICQGQIGRTYKPSPLGQMDIGSVWIGGEDFGNIQTCMLGHFEGGHVSKAAFKILG